MSHEEQSALEYNNGEKKKEERRITVFLHWSLNEPKGRRVRFISHYQSFTINVVEHSRMAYVWYHQAP